MGETIRVLAIDYDERRVKEIKHQLSEQNADLEVEYSTDLISLIQLIETNNFDCIISPHDTSLLTKTELRHRIAQIISLPVIHYLVDSRLPASTQHHGQFEGILIDDDPSSYQLLANRIKQTITLVPDRDNQITFALPDTPKVIAKGTRLFIVDEYGREEFWGCEPEYIAAEIAHQMEIELKAVSWVKEEMERFIYELTQLVKSSEVPPGDVPNVIFEGYRSLLFSFKKLHDCFNEI
ncbi:MAG: hypothetical protein ACFFEK_14835 [Candidatus Thorarchaeota archaeon]